MAIHTEDKIPSPERAERKMNGWLALSPLAVFLVTYVVTALVARDFYKVPVAAAFILASAWAMLSTRGISVDRKISVFSSGAGDRNGLLRKSRKSVRRPSICGPSRKTSSRKPPPSNCLNGLETKLRKRFWKRHRRYLQPKKASTAFLPKNLLQPYNQTTCPFCCLSDSCLINRFLTEKRQLSGCSILIRPDTGDSGIKQFFCRQTVILANR